MVGLSAMPAFLQRAVAATPDAQQEAARRAVSARRGDGLNIVVPSRIQLLPHASYDRHSSAQAWRTDAAIDLDGFFGLHPSLAPLEPALSQESTCDCGMPPARRIPLARTSTRRDFMESGTPGLKSTEDGWLNRAVETVPEENSSPFRAVAMGPTYRACCMEEHRPLRCRT